MNEVCVTLQVNGAFQRAADALEAGELPEGLDRVVESLESDPKSALQSLEVTQQVANSATCAKYCLLSTLSQQSRHSHLLACLTNAAATRNRLVGAICPQAVPCGNCAQLCLRVVEDRKRDAHVAVTCVYSSKQAKDTRVYRAGSLMCRSKPQHAFKL